jgi:tryptophan 2,3-dioxygenase
MVEVFRHDPAIYTALLADLHAPSLWDEFLRHLSRRGFAIPADKLERDFCQPYVADPGVVAVFKQVYEAPREHWDAYEMAEKLVDVETAFQTWRFRHMKTVERVIGFKTGTGGSSGVAFLKRALELTFFPELFLVRTELGQ